MSDLLLNRAAWEPQTDRDPTRFFFAGGRIVNLQAQYREFRHAKRHAVVESRQIQWQATRYMSRNECLLAGSAGGCIRHVAMMYDGPVVGPNLDGFNPRIFQKHVRENHIPVWDK